MRVIDAQGEQLGILTLSNALLEAEKAGLDLVEISPNAEPPVCRVMDFGKYRFELNKRETAQKKKQKLTQIKEIKLRPATDVGDYQIKLKAMIKFIESGDKVKVTLRFRGREMAHPELGTDLLKRVEGDVAELAIVEQFPRLEGRQMVMVIAPKKK